MTSPLTEPALELAGAGVALGGRPVLRDIDLAVNTGEVVALLGANGSGKSTLVRAAVGLHPLRTGQARLFGTPLATYDAWQRIGYVPQRATAATGVPATVWEVVASGRLSRRRLFTPLGRAGRAAIETALDTVGLAHRARHPVSTLSGGQQQRVLMARALAGEPDLMLLDEPNAGVDLASQRQVADALAARSAVGATILVVLHELGPFEPLIDRVVVLREGRVAYDGVPDGLHPAHHHPDHHGHHERDGVSVRVDFVPEIRAPFEERR